MVIVIMLNLGIIHEIKMDMLITKVHLRDTFWPLFGCKGIGEQESFSSHSLRGQQRLVTINSFKELKDGRKIL